MKSRVVGQPGPRNEYSIPRAVVASNSGAKQWKPPRTLGLVVFFWTLVVTMAMCWHLLGANASAKDVSVVRQGHMPVTLGAKLNVFIVDGPPYDTLLTYRVCCRFPGGHMECPSERDAECHVMRDQGPRLTCFWLAPRLEGAECVFYWVAAAVGAAVK
jgi:hypothetical protein